MVDSKKARYVLKFKRMLKKGDAILQQSRMACSRYLFIIGLENDDLLFNNTNNINEGTN